ncbi:hypothetical protein CRUP_024291 [Coryphaenoides rupestris]|nr:hypothetical protein CRUP_024291 [Coryphaenoides rupestris]
MSPPLAGRQTSLILHHRSSSTHSQVTPTTELLVRSFLDMGFTDTQAELLNDTVFKAKGSAAAAAAAQQTLSALTALLVLGLNPSSVLKALEKCPELYHVKVSEFNQRISNLRKLGLVEGSLQRVVAHYPQILTIPVKRVKVVVLFIREKCLFTVQQVTDILRDHPAVLQEDLDQLEYKFQYVYFRMGVKQAEIVRHKLFRYTLEEVRQRHCFLERRGLYQTPDKKGQTFIENPKLSQTYLAHIALATAEEYDIFGKMMEREWQEEDEEWRERDRGADGADEGYDDEDDGEQGDEMEADKSSYYKRKKRS